MRAEPFSEPAHQLRISVLADGDDIAGALKAFDHCKAVLWAELGVEPSADTQAVLRQALGQAGARAPAASPHGEAAAGQAAAAAADAAAPFARLSVLVVEDHPFQRRTALALLRGLGVGTLAGAEDGNAALEWLAGSPPPDVIICDIDMPGMDGVEFIRRVARARPGERGRDRQRSGPAAAEHDQVRQRGLRAAGARGRREAADGAAPERAAGRLPPAAAPRRRWRRDVGDARSPTRSPATASSPSCSRSSTSPAARVSAAQVVARWLQPGGSPIDQPQFEHLLEGEELAAVFVDRLVGLLCDQLHELDAAGQAIDLWLAIPDAALADLTLADRLVEQVRACGADPRRIVCAIGAQALRRGAALHVLARLRVMGFGVCLDDFAGAHATVGQLERIPVTAVRLAQELICGAHADPRAHRDPPGGDRRRTRPGASRRRRRLRDRRGLRAAAGGRLRLRAGSGHRRRDAGLAPGRAGRARGRRR